MEKAMRAVQGTVTAVGEGRKFTALRLIVLRVYAAAISQNSLPWPEHPFHPAFVTEAGYRGPALGSSTAAPWGDNLFETRTKSAWPLE
jgi:hypothetical protein